VVGRLLVATHRRRRTLLGLVHAVNRGAVVLLFTCLVTSSLDSSSLATFI
jgi:hypothetical protein